MADLAEQLDGEPCPECASRAQEERDQLITMLRENHRKLMRVYDALPEHDAEPESVEWLSLKLEMTVQQTKAHLGRLRKLGLAKSTGNGKPGRVSKDNPDRWGRA